tara:strand:+ start:34 stop:840 length:807 start_codon:yes stop_codon:yes gene_type:complete
MKKLVVIMFSVVLFGGCEFLLSEGVESNINKENFNQDEKINMIKRDFVCYTEKDLMELKSFYEDSIENIYKRQSVIKTEINQSLYLDWNNLFSVNASGYKLETVKLSSSGGVSIKGPDRKGFYSAVVTSSRAKKVKVMVSATNKMGENIELANETFRVFPLPKPTAYFAGKAGGNLKKVNAVSYSKLKASLGQSPLDVPYSVVSFTMFTTKGGAPIELNSKSDKLTPQMKAALKKIPKNGSLIFTRVKVKGPRGRISQLESSIVLKMI